MNEKGTRERVTVAHQMAADVCIDGAQRVIQQHNIRRGVYGSGNRNTLLLSAAEVHATLADLSQIAAAQDLNVYARERNKERVRETNSREFEIKNMS